MDIHKLKQIFLSVLCIACFTIPIGFYLYQKRQYHEQFHTLITRTSSNIVAVDLYSRIGGPVGLPIKFKPFDTIVQEFFESCTDSRSYWPTHDTLASDEHMWFLEIFMRGGRAVSVRFYIPSGKGDIVVGQIKGYGSFQSKLLYQWYQKYSHHWLNPEGL